MSRSYQHGTCDVCGLRVSSNGMGRDAHIHSRAHVDALRERMRKAVGKAKVEIAREVEKLEREIDQRKARRAGHRNG